MTITVAIPYYGCPDLVERAVRSVLDQTHKDLHVVVIGDGEDPPLSAISDSRLDVFTMPENRGSYFALQVALLGIGHRWFSPFGADDYAQPDHLERLVELRRNSGVDAIATGAVFTNNGQVHRGLYEVGMFCRRRLLAIGGYNPSERIGQDTLMLRLLRLTGSLVSTDVATYHRVKRPGALTTSLDTGFGSPARQAMRARNRAVFAHAERLRHPEAIRVYRQSLIPVAIADELAEQVERLNARVGERVAA